MSIKNIKSSEMKWPMPLDSESLSSSALDIENKQRSNLFQWNGQFSPQLIETLLRRYGKSKYTVVDPFMGSGTVIVEAAKLNMSSVGTDVNPAAYNIASIYKLINFPINDRQIALSYIESRFFNLVDSESSIFGTPCCDSIPILELIRSLEIFGRGIMEATENIPLISNAWATLLGRELESSKPKLASLIFRKLQETILALPYSDFGVTTFNGDCRSLPSNSSIADLVITSPPYINVFNYHQQYRKAVEELGFHPLLAAQSEIGANRKHRGNRFLTVIEYCLDMAQCLIELCRVCREGSRAIFVVGKESNVRGVAFPNGLMVYEVAKALGIDLILRQERKFLNRFGEAIYEDILHFKLSKSAKNAEDAVREIACIYLNEAKIFADQAVESDLEKAIAKVYDLKSSPLYDGTYE